MVGHIHGIALAGEVIDQLWSHCGRPRRQDEIGDFPAQPPSPPFSADVPYGLLNLRNAVGGERGESDRSQRLKIVHIITDVRHLLHIVRSWRAMRS